MPKGAPGELERDWGQGMEAQDNREGLGWDIGKELFPVRVGRAGTEQQWLPLDPWQCPRPGWTGLGAAWDSRRCPCPWQGWHWMILKVPSNPNNSTNL